MNKSHDLTQIKQLISLAQKNASIPEVASTVWSRPQRVCRE